MASPVATDVDAALNDLVERHWQWIQAGRSAGEGRGLAVEAARLAAELPAEHRPFAQALGEGVEGAVEHPPPPPPEMLVSDPGPPLVPTMGVAGSSSTRVLRERLEAYMEKLGPPPPSPLPARNRGHGGPHVELFSENGGLVHGGVVRGPARTLVCRAFRLLRATRTGGSPGATAGTTVVVAGVAEVRDVEGRVLERWSTAERLTGLYQDCTQPLPAYATRSQGLETFGHYYASRHLVDQLDARAADPQNATLQRPVESPDDGRPFLAFANGTNPYFLGPPSPFQRGPGPESAIEHPYYEAEPAVTSGFVIATPYVLVFAPDPRLSKAVVAMAGVYREARFRLLQQGKLPSVSWRWGLTGDERRGRWVTRSVELG